MKTKALPIDPANFDGDQFEVAQNLPPGSVTAFIDKNGVHFVQVPDTVPDDAVVIFPKAKTEQQKLAASIVDAKIHDQVEWDGLSDREAMNRLRTVLLKNAALVITGKADETKIPQATAEAVAASADAFAAEATVKP